MKPHISKFFLLSSGILLFVTGLAKIISSFGHAPILQIPTPILSFSYQKVFLLVGVCELIIGLICFFGTKSIFQRSRILEAMMRNISAGAFYWSLSKALSLFGQSHERIAYSAPNCGHGHENHSGVSAHRQLCHLVLALERKTKNCFRNNIVRKASNLRIVVLYTT